MDLDQLQSKKPINHIGNNVNLGKNVKIWHFVYIGDETEIGDDVSIGSLSHIDYNVKIGKGSRIAGLAYIPPLTIIGKNVFIGPAVVITNDPYPLSSKLVGVTIEDNAIIGASSSIKSGVRIGKNSVIGMGSLITKDVPPNTLVMGSPAKIRYSRIKYDKKREAWEKS
jgi:acetyltransferase-like isoleucine patch superfamily enzyme